MIIDRFALESYQASCGWRSECHKSWMQDATSCVLQVLFTGLGDHGCSFAEVRMAEASWNDAAIERGKL
jgi:hypothetical protein